MSDPIFDPTAGPAREPIDPAAVDSAGNSVVIDPRRRRPRYFDGRFLAARDLTRDQAYFLTRQADLGRILGGGIAHGLEVTLDGADRSLTISAGHGLTPAGEVVLLRDDLRIELSNIPQAMRLDAVFGLERQPRPPRRTLTGLFVLALRPVEFTANPVAAYPRTLTGDRTLHDGDVIEAAAVTLVPYPLEGTAQELSARRADAAREIFSRGAPRGVPTEALALAMIGVRRGVVEWIDPWLVRREAGVGFSLGGGRRALREAFLRQYDLHLRDLMGGLDGGAGFAASDHFHVLPPAGRLPRGSVRQRGNDLIQIFFPSTMDVQLSVVPADELPALVEESLSLPAIDLGLSAEAMETISVSVLLPLSREAYANHVASLANQGETVDPRTLRLISAAPVSIARLKPRDLLNRLQFKRVAIDQGGLQAELAPWVDLLSEVETLWFVRRRNLAHANDSVVRAQAALAYPPGDYQPPGDFQPPGDQPPGDGEPGLGVNFWSPEIESRLAEYGELNRFDTWAGGVNEADVLRVQGLLEQQPQILGQPLLVSGLIAELEGLPPGGVGEFPPPEGDRLALWQKPELGTGIQELTLRVPDLNKIDIRRGIAAAMVMPELDDRLTQFGVEDYDAIGGFLRGAAGQGDFESIRMFAFGVINPLVNAMIREAFRGRNGLDHLTRTLGVATRVESSLNRLVDALPGLAKPETAKFLAETGALPRLARLIKRVPAGNVRLIRRRGKAIVTAAEAQNKEALEKALLTFEEAFQ